MFLSSIFEKKRVLFYFLLLIFLSNFPVFAQTSPITIKYIQTLIEQDSITKAQKEVDSKITYYKSVKRYDSLVKFIQFEGSFKLNKGNKKQAIQKAETLIAEIKKANDNVTTQDALKELAWVYDNAGNVQKAYDIAIEATTYASKIKDPKSTALASIYYKMGYYSSFLGNYTLANKNYQLALSLLKKSKQNDYEFYNQVYNALGGVKWQEAKLDSAKYYFEQAIIVLEKTDANDIMNKHYRPALIKMNLAVLGNALGKNNEAIKNSEEAIKGFQNFINESTDESRVAKAKGNQLVATDNLAVFYNTLGQYSRSQELIEYSYSQKKKLYEKDDMNLIISQIILAEAKIASQDFEGANKNIDDALDLLKTSHGADLYWQAAALSTKATICDNLGDIKNAEIFYEKSEIIYRKSNDGASQGFLDGMLQQSLFYAENGRRNKAISLATEMYDITHNGDYKNTIQQFYHTLNLAQVNFSLKNYNEALKYSREALEYKVTSENGSVSASDSILGQYRKPQALLINAQSRYFLATEKNEKFIKSILAEIEEGISILDQRKKVVNNIEDNTLLLKENENLLNFAEKLRLELFNKTKDNKYLDDLIALHESSIYNRIRSRLNLQENVAFQNIPADVIIKEKDLKAKMISSLEESEEGNISTFFEASNKWEAFLENLKKQYPKYYKMRYATLEQSIADLQQKIPENTTVIRYIFIEEDLYAFVVSSNIKKMIKLDFSKVKNYIPKLKNNDFSVQEMSPMLYELYNSLWFPLDKFVKTEKVVIIPDLDLFNLSFETLTPKPIKDFKEISTNSLLAKYDISYNFSLLLFKDKRKVANYSSEFIAFAPGFNKKMKDEYTVSIKDSVQLDKAYLNLLPQPFSEDLVKQYAKTFKGEFFINENANKEIFVNQAKEHKIIHIGTHAESNNISPELSRLIFAKKTEGRTDYDANSLYSYEIYNIDLSSNLAILTACETGKPTYQAGEGMISLAHAFNYAGSESILTSLWEIDEESSAKIVKLFYDNLSDGMPKDEALRKAKLSYIATAEGRTASPQYWAGLVLIGDTSPIHLNTGISIWWWVFGGLIVLFFIYILIAYRKRD